MMSADRDALLCDLAEVYGIYDMRALPVATLAALAAGLREDSRIRMCLSGAKATRVETLLAAAVDRLSLMWWAQTEDGRKNKNRPSSILSILLGEQPETPAEVVGFTTGADFESEWSRITEG